MLTHIFPGENSNINTISRIKSIKGIVLMKFEDYDWINIGMKWQCIPFDNFCEIQSAISDEEMKVSKALRVKPNLNVSFRLVRYDGMHKYSIPFYNFYVL
jgi:hypothetical protein